MSDRCYVNVFVHLDNYEALTRWLFGKGEKPDAEEADENGVIMVEDSESNYGWGDARQNAADEGIPFYGYHCEGGEYGALEFASVNGKQMHQEIDHDGNIVVQVSRAGQIDPDHLDTARAYLALRAEAERVVNDKVCEYCAQTGCDLNFGACDEAQAGGFDGPHPE